MLSPFPGMDPFLEDAEVWVGFHTDLAIQLKRTLNQQIGPKYYADVEIQSAPHDLDLEIANEIRPDISILEPLDMAEPMTGAHIALAIPAAPIMRPAPLSVKLRSVRIFRTKTREVVTSIELLSPTNKRSGSDGLRDYRRKRTQILTSRVHLVEIDLLRGGSRPAPELEDGPLDTDYVLLVNRAHQHRISEIWPVALNEPLPLIPVPLLPPDPDIPLDLNAAIRHVYQESRYDWRIQYQSPVPPPPIRPTMAGWVESLLATHTQSAAKQ